MFDFDANTKNLIDTLKRGLAQVENNQCRDLNELRKTLKVMASVCDKAAANIEVKSMVKGG